MIEKTTYKFGDYQFGLTDAKTGWFNHINSGFNDHGVLYFALDENGNHELVGFDGALYLPDDLADGIRTLGIYVDLEFQDSNEGGL